MARQKPSGPADARALHRALEDLGAAPIVDPEQRPRGVEESDAPVLLGALLAKVELDASERADPGEEPPAGFSDLLVGYRAVSGSLADGEIELRLLALRLVRTGSEIGLVEEDDALTDAAVNATLAAANLVNCYRLRRHARGKRAHSRAAFASAERFADDLASDLKRAHL